MTWQPIETAPKDGTAIDLWVSYEDGSGQRVTDCTWFNGRWWPGEGPTWQLDEGDGEKITHWRPLPNPPESQS